MATFIDVVSELVSTELEKFHRYIDVEKLEEISTELSRAYEDLVRRKIQMIVLGFEGGNNTTMTTTSITNHPR
jgi:hypothetical protein